MEEERMIIDKEGRVHVLIPIGDYEELVRISERLRVVENYVRRTDYASRKDLLLMLGVEEKAGEE